MFLLPSFFQPPFTSTEHNVPSPVPSQHLILTQAPPLPPLVPPPAATYYLDDFSSGGDKFQDGAVVANNPAVVALQVRFCALFGSHGGSRVGGCGRGIGRRVACHGGAWVGGEWAAPVLLLPEVLHAAHACAVALVAEWREGEQSRGGATVAVRAPGAGAFSPACLPLRPPPHALSLPSTLFTV